MRVVVTGATGNIGTALLPHLLRAGHTVQAVVRRPAPGWLGPDAVRWTALDLADEAARGPFERLCRGADALVHLAWGFQPMRRPDLLAESGPGAAGRCVDAALAAGVDRVVQLSSVAAYRPRTSLDPADEGHPLGGIRSCTYSQDKVRAEAAGRAAAHRHDALERLTLLRPCMIGQRAAGGMMLRCSLPAIVPSCAVDRLLLLPVDPDFRMQLIHADDVALAIVRCLERDVGGAFNLAGDDVLDGEDMAKALQAMPIRDIPPGVRGLVAGAWAAHLHSLEPGWVDMANRAPMVSCARAHDELGWRPRHRASDVLAELIAGMADGAGADTPALRPRTIRDGLRRFVRDGTVARRAMT